MLFIHSCGLLVGYQNFNLTTGEHLEGQILSPEKFKGNGKVYLETSVFSVRRIYCDIY